MIPNRLLLRALTVLALSRGGQAPFPTMAGEAVYDTRLEPITDIATEGMSPVILVYTDTDMRQNVNRNTAGTWSRKVALIIELSICSVKKTPDGTGSFEWLETSAEIEAMLDIFELQVEHAFADVTNPFAMQWSKLVKRFEAYESTPSRSAEQAVRYAVRQLHFDIELATDCRPSPAITAPETTPYLDEEGVLIPGSLLPIYYLGALEQSIATEPFFEGVRSMLTGASLSPVLPALKSVHVAADIKGPNGTAPVAAHIEDLDQ